MKLNFINSNKKIMNYEKKQKLWKMLQEMTYKMNKIIQFINIILTILMV